MKTAKKLVLLKALKILLLIVFVPLLLFYLSIILPEYLACINCNSEGAMGTDIWGYEVQCYGESKDIGEAFFQFVSLIISGFLIVMLMVFYLSYRLKRSV